MYVCMYVMYVCMHSLPQGLLILSLNHRYNEKPKSYPRSCKLSVGGVVIKSWRQKYAEQTDISQDYFDQCRYLMD